MQDLDSCTTIPEACGGTVIGVEGLGIRVQDLGFRGLGV